MLIEALIAFFILLFFIALDYFSFIIRKSVFGEDKIQIRYFPDKRILGLGSILATYIFLYPLFKYIVKIKTGIESWDMILSIGKLFFILALIGFILSAIVKIAIED